MKIKLQRIVALALVLQMGALPNIVTADESRKTTDEKKIIEISKIEKSVPQTEISTTIENNSDETNDNTTKELESTTVAEENETDEVEQVVIFVAQKKVKFQKAKIKLKKIKDAKGYQISIYTTRKNAKKDKNVLVKKMIKNPKSVIKSSKLKNRKKLYVRARAYKFIDGKQLFGGWSKIKRMDIVSEQKEKMIE